MSDALLVKPALIDTHCHLNHTDLLNDIDAVIDRAEAHGIEQMIVVGFDLPSSDLAVEIADRHASVYAAVAVHPHDARNYDPSTETRLRDLATHPRVVAIGEIGLDFHYDFSPVADQDAAFRAQLTVARESGLPVIIHCREAYDEVLGVLEEESAQWAGGVMHCWGGNLEQAERTLRLGFYLGFGGVITFKNADEMRDVAKSIPMERLLLETDAPYLAPVPYRGKRNEPAYVALVAEKLGELREISLEAVAKVTTGNAMRLFTKMNGGCS